MDKSREGINKDRRRFIQGALTIAGVAIPLARLNAQVTTSDPPTTAAATTPAPTTPAATTTISPLTASWYYWYVE